VQSPEIAVATPSCLDDFCSSGVIIMGKVKHLAVDKDGRMLDMGLEPQIRKIIENNSLPQPGLDEG